MARDKTFTLFWRTGDRNVVEGRNVAEAMTLAGFGAGSLPALDFHATGDCDHYEWDAAKREWEPTPKHPEYQTFQAAALAAAQETK